MMRLHFMLLTCLLTAGHARGMLAPANELRHADSRPSRRTLQQVDSADVHPWATLLGNSFLFYEAQQSGVLPNWNRARRALPGGWRDNAHTTDGADLGLDLSGGFYDAGDHVKFLLPMTAAMTFLGIGAMVHEQGYRAANEWDNMARNMKWATDFLIKCHTVASDTAGDNMVVTQVGDTGTDHAYWGRPEQQTGYRPTKTTQSQNQGASDIMGGMAAVLAGGAMVFSKPGALQDTTYAAQLIKRARQLLAAADAKPGRWSDAAYSSSNDKDEIAMGYAMVCWFGLLSKPSSLPTSCSTAFTRYMAAFNELQGSVNNDWDTKLISVSAVLQYLGPALAAANNGNTPNEVVVAADHLAGKLSSWQDTLIACPTTPVGDGWWQICETAGGLAFLTRWGSLRHSMNIAFAATLHAASLAASGNTTVARKQRCWARSQLMYAAGTNPEKQSFIVGYTPAGVKAADRPHHRSSSCDPDYSVPCTFSQLSAPGPNPSVLKGALVGGPNNLDKFDNNRQDYQLNEVALDFNAGFTGALASTVHTTAQLAAAGCSWTSYCAGSCDAAADASSPLRTLVPSFESSQGSVESAAMLETHAHSHSHHRACP